MELNWDIEKNVKEKIEQRRKQWRGYQGKKMQETKMLISAL